MCSGSTCSHSTLSDPFRQWGRSQHLLRNLVSQGLRTVQSWACLLSELQSQLCAVVYGLHLRLFKTPLVNVGLWYQSDACLTLATRGIWQLQSLSQLKNWHFVKVPAALTYSAAPWSLSGVLPDSLRFIGKSGVTWLCWQRRLMVEIRAAALELWIPKCNLLPSGRLQSLHGLEVSSLEKYNPSSWCCEQHIYMDMF